MNKILSLILGVIAGAGLFAFSIYIISFISLGNIEAFIWGLGAPIMVTLIVNIALGLILPFGVFLYFRKKYPYFVIGVVVGVILILLWGMRMIFQETIFEPVDLGVARVE